MRVCTGLLSVLLGFLPAAGMLAQTTTVSVQCWCDLSAHPPGFDCRTYCCNGPARNHPTCAGSSSGSSSGSLGSGSGSDALDTLAVVGAVAQLVEELTRQRTPAEQANTANEKGRKAYEKARKAYERGRFDEALRRLGEAQKQFELAAALMPSEPVFSGNVDLAKRFTAEILARRQGGGTPVDSNAQQAALAQQQREQEQSRRDQALADQARRTREEFEQSKATVLAAMEEGSAGDPEEPESGDCVASCPTVAGVMGSREVDPECVRRCLLSEESAAVLGTGATELPMPSADIGDSGEIRESDYFFDVQARQTGPRPIGAMPTRVAPTPAPGGISQQRAGSFQAAGATRPHGLPGPTAPQVTTKPNDAEPAARQQRGTDPSVSPAFAKFVGTRVGQVHAVVDAAVELADGSLRPLTAESPIGFGDRIRTGPKGRLQVQLQDGTVFTMGPNGDMVLDDFVYDPTDNEDTVRVSIVKGAFRYVTGRIASKEPTTPVTLKTPNAYTGIRGTQFLLVYDPVTKSTAYWLHEGGIDITPVATGRKLALDAPMAALIDEAGDARLASLTPEAWTVLQMLFESGTDFTAAAADWFTRPAETGLNWQTILFPMEGLEISFPGGSIAHRPDFGLSGRPADGTVYSLELPGVVLFARVDEFPDTMNARSFLDLYELETDSKTDRRPAGCSAGFEIAGGDASGWRQREIRCVVASTNRLYTLGAAFSSREVEEAARPMVDAFFDSFKVVATTAQ